MCILQSNAIADALLQSLSAKERAACERKYALLAGEDSVEVPNGLWKLMHPVSDWATNDVLRGVRKVKSGRHRLYFIGWHTDCQYTLVYLLVNKRDEGDTPGDTAFQNRVLLALSDDEPCRVIAAPDVENELSGTLIVQCTG